MRHVVVSLLFLTACSAPKREAPPAEQAVPLRITQFYASPGVIASGDSAMMCYGVEGAESVRLEPAAEKLTPLAYRCFHVSPTASTTYKLTARAKTGEETSQTAEVRVEGKRAASPSTAPSAARPPQDGPQILLFLAAQNEIPAGMPVTLCYGVSGATSVRLEPEPGEAKVSEKTCVTAKPAATTTYTLTATDASGRRASQKVTVRTR
ncbi:MAG: hypothetical protein SFV54_13125 [Bryobacteraceae bacterium]|nr:hypothetical protein [Bryobacteraceae bacterium]